MENVVQFPSVEGRVINGRFIRQPKTGAEYLSICKELFPRPEYEGILLAIMDEEYYNMMDYKLQAVVKTYREFRV